MRVRKESQVFLLFAGSRVLGKSPFDVAARALLQCTSADLEKSHRHARSNFGQLHIPVSSLDENMVAHFDVVVLVHKADNTVADLSSLARGEKMLQNLNNAGTQLRLESLEDQVGVAFRHGTASGIRNILAKDNIVKREAGRRAMGKV